jgi:hypothetical protein
VLLENFSTHTLIKISSRYCAGTGSVVSANTWRKEHKSETFATLMGKRKRASATSHGKQQQTNHRTARTSLVAPTGVSVVVKRTQFAS